MSCVVCIGGRRRLYIADLVPLAPLYLCPDPEKQNDCTKYVCTCLSLDQFQKHFVVMKTLSWSKHLIVSIVFLYVSPSTIMND